MKLLLIIISLFLVPVCSFTQSKFDTANYVILPKTSHWCPYTSDKKCKATDLSVTEIIQLDSLLQSCIAAYNIEETRHYNTDKERFPKFAPRLEDYIITLQKYKRQFIPVINANGEKEVWVNCFRSEDIDHSYWRKTVVFVNDGGNYYFNVKINLATKKYYALRVNGVG